MGEINQIGKEVMMFHFGLRRVYHVVSKQFTVSHRKTSNVDIC